MVSWAADGGLSGYDPVTRRLKPGMALFVRTTLGTVDSNTITRLGVAMDPSNEATLPLGITRPNVWTCTAPLTITASDLTANGITTTNHKYISVGMWIAPKSTFGDASPTPSQIKAHGVQVGRATTFRNTVGTHTFTLNGPNRLANVKYWVLLLPVVVNTSGVGIADVVPAGYTVDGIGKALSLWTNRTPSAPTLTISSQIVAPGDPFTLSYVPADPDQVGPPDDADRLNRDLAGVEFQYAPLPTPDNPSPTWMPLQFTDAAGAANWASWSIKGTDTAHNHDALRTALSATVTAGANPEDVVGTAVRGSLPSGDWQIRCRTFDFGHPYPNEVRPLGWKVSGNGPTPADFPAANTSPWSAAVRVSTPTQVPPPLPLSPKDDRSVVSGTDVTLTWQYRNTATPPFPQAERVVEIREVGATDWTTLVSESSSSASYVVTGYDLVVGTHHEWRVKVRDSDGEWSTVSDSARFWVVPAPTSGGSRPDPSSTVEGASLGCGTHRVEVYRRGGTVRVGEITNISHVDWERKRDDISTAEVQITGWDLDCGNLLASLQTWAYEIVIWRDNGFSVDRVWEGPITLITYESDKVTIDAKDVMAYAYRRVIRQATTNSGDTTVVGRAASILQNAFGPDDPNVLGYLTVLEREDDSLAYRTTPAYSRTAFEEVDDMAANAGLDYVVAGRSILLWGTKHRIGTLPEFRDADLGSSPIVSEYGMSMANAYAVSDGNGIWGVATRGGLSTDGQTVSGNDETYGLVEMLSSTWADDNTGTGPTTPEQIAATRQSFAESSERSIADRYPPPVVVRIPDNTTLNPGTVISIQQLVPGVLIPLRSTSTLREVVGSQKLDSIKVVEESGTEKVSITMSSFTRDDIDVTEDGGGA